VPGAKSDGGLLRSYAMGPNGAPVGEPFVLWAPRKPEDDAITEVAREAYAQETAFEYRRLLYVAMTRARERLYVCGWTGVKGRMEGSWHELVEAALGRIGKQAKGADGEPILRLEKKGKPRDAEKLRGAQEVPPIPKWARAPAALERAPKRLSPSSLDEEPPVFAPGAASGKAARRGSLVHRLLEVLPDLPPDRRADAAAKFLAAFADDFTKEEQDELARETLHLFALPELAPIFGPESRAEVAISGRMEIGGHVEQIAGRVDRLAYSDGAAWVVDYKTNRPAADTLDEVAPIYWTQMASYRALLRQSDPRIKVHCALVWTHAPSFMVLPEDRLEAQWLEIAGKSGA